MSKQPGKSQLPAETEDKNNTFGKNFIDGTIEAASGAGLIAGSVALVKAITHHELSPSEIFLISILGPGVAHAITEGTMKFVNKFGADHDDQPKGKLMPAGSRKVPAIEADQPKQLAAPAKLDLKGVDHKQLHQGDVAEGTKAMKSASSDAPKVHPGAQQQHARKAHKSHKPGQHH